MKPAAKTKPDASVSLRPRRCSPRDKRSGSSRILHQLISSPITPAGLLPAVSFPFFWPPQETRVPAFTLFPPYRLSYRGPPDAADNALPSHGNHPSAQMRALVKQVDDDEMTFLMHAVSGGSGTGSTSTGICDDSTTALGASASGAPRSAPGRSSVPARRRRQTHPQGSDKADGEGAAEDPGDGGSGGGGGGGGRSGGDAAELGEVGPKVPTSASAAGGAMDPTVVVFRTAWWLVQEVLWKEQVR